MTKINSCTYLNPCSKEFSNTNEKFKKLRGDKKFLVVLATFFAGVASFFMGGLGGLAAYRKLVNKFSEIKKEDLSDKSSTKKTDDVKDRFSLGMDITQEQRDKEIAEIQKRALEAEEEEVAKIKKREKDAIEKERLEFASIPPLPGYEHVNNFTALQEFFKTNPSDELIQKLAKSSVWKISRERRLSITEFYDCPEDKVSLIAKSIADSPRHIRALINQFCIYFENYSPNSSVMDSDFKKQSYQKYKKGIVSVFEALNEDQKMSFLIVDPLYNHKERFDTQMMLEFMVPLLIEIKEDLKLTPEFLAKAQKFVRKT